MNEPIRVVQIMGKLWAGGVEMVVFNYYRAIDKTKVQFDFYYDADSTVEPAQELVDMGARFIKLPPYQKLSSYLKTLEKYLRKNKYDIIHSHINTLNVFPLYVAWKCNIPIRIAHNHSVPGGESIKRTGLKYFFRLFSKVFSNEYFACSEKAGRWMFGNKNYEIGKVKIMKNAVNFDRFNPPEKLLKTMKKSLGINDKLVIGHVGRFTFAKNHKFLINIFKNISKIRNDAVLMLVGDGEMHDQIYQWVEEAELKDKVIFVGQVNNPELYYRLADVMVIPSVFEGLSLATIESQIAGVPTVVSSAVPEDAVISNGCVRLKLKSNEWVKTILEQSKKKVVLDERSLSYNIQTASKLLQEWYLKKVGDVNA